MCANILRRRGPAVNKLASARRPGYAGCVTQADGSYILDEQIGFVLRRATQRHLAIFSEAIPELTTTQFAVLAKLAELGPLSQNHLGRVTAMDAATIKGVVDRMVRQELLFTEPDPEDRRRLTVRLTEAGAALFAAKTHSARQVTQMTLSPLSATEKERLLALLSRIA